MQEKNPFLRLVPPESMSLGRERVPQIIQHMVPELADFFADIPEMDLPQNPYEATRQLLDTYALSTQQQVTEETLQNGLREMRDYRFFSFDSFGGKEYDFFVACGIDNSGKSVGYYALAYSGDDEKGYDMSWSSALGDGREISSNTLHVPDLENIRIMLGQLSNDMLVLGALQADVITCVVNPDLEPNPPGPGVSQDMPKAA